MCPHPSDHSLRARSEEEGGEKKERKGEREPHFQSSIRPDKNGKTPLELAGNDEVKAAFAELTVITDDNKDALLLACAGEGLAPLLVQCCRLAPMWPTLIKTATQH